jgi:hypothetical protein
MLHPQKRNSFTLHPWNPLSAFPSLLHHPFCYTSALLLLYSFELLYFRLFKAGERFKFI